MCRIAQKYDLYTKNYRGSDRNRHCLGPIALNYLSYLEELIAEGFETGQSLTV